MVVVAHQPELFQRLAECHRADWRAAVVRVAPCQRILLVWKDCAHQFVIADSWFPRRPDSVTQRTPNHSLM